MILDPCSDIVTQVKKFLFDIYRPGRNVQTINHRKADLQVIFLSPKLLSQQGSFLYLLSYPPRLSYTWFSIAGTVRCTAPCFAALQTSASSLCRMIHVSPLAFNLLLSNLAHLLIKVLLLKHCIDWFEVI